MCWRNRDDVVFLHICEMAMICFIVNKMDRHNESAAFTSTNPNILSFKFCTVSLKRDPM